VPHQTGGRGHLVQIGVVLSSAMSWPVRLNVDFNYGGGDPTTNQGAVMLYPKSGDRTGMLAHIKSQFEAAGVVPVDGMTVVLIDKRADTDEVGRECDMVVEGRLQWHPDSRRWSAAYEWDAMTWIPSDPE
jgi:hypothetical protein